MNNFMQDAKQELDRDSIKISENGNIGFETSGHALVDFFFKIGSFRNMPNEKVIESFAKMFNENKNLAIKMLFYSGDMREGLGERRLFKLIIKWLAERATNDFSDEKVYSLVKLIPFYTRWDNLFVLKGTKWEDAMLQVIKEQLRKDLSEERISLLGKWLPSANTSSQETRILANWMMKKLGYTPRDWRVMLSSLRKKINVTEVYISSNDWSNIDYSLVPSKANLKYNSAFLRHDNERRMEFINKSKVINGKVNFPYEIIHKLNNTSYRDDDAIKSLEKLWDNLNQIDGLKNTLVVRDGSGSMTTRLLNTKIQLLEVADSLTLYCAERNGGGFRNSFITFSANPKIITLNANDRLVDKLRYIRCLDDCTTTNIESVFDLVLKTAIAHKYKQEELPNQILILSDMEFNMISGKKFKGMDNIKERFEQNGYKLPKLIFWNIGSRTISFPLQENDNGLLLVGGFSPVILNLVCSEEKDPYKAIVKILNSERYYALNL